MRRFLLTGIIIFCTLYFISAQDTEQKIKIYKTWVSFNNIPSTVKGVLYEVKDSSIVVSHSLQVRDYIGGRIVTVDLQANTIERIKIRRKNKILKSAVIGAVSGFVVGAIIGFAEGDDPPCTTGSWYGCTSYTAGEKALINGATVGLVGCGVGAIVGIFRIKIPINGNMDNYNRSKSRLNEYAIKKY